jgi:GNAT superfamily N-acetyltransferase
MSFAASTINIGPLVETDLLEAHGLTAALRWPHRLEDLQVMLALGQGIAVRDGAGMLVGTALLWPWGANAATVGLILVRGDRQGQGIGRLLVERLIGMAEGRAMRLQATEAGVKLYERAGFRRVGLVRQLQGEARRQAAAARTRLVTAADHEAIVALDAAQFGARREALTARLLADGQGVVTETSGAVSGFAVARVFGRGNLIGPVVAGSTADAEALVAASLVDGFNRIDVTGAGDALQPLLDRVGLKVVDTVIVMTRGDWPACAPSPAAYALASHAFG